jgi:asparagine synthase (glutamine-hydrolysing)
MLYFLRYCRFKGVYTCRRLIVAVQKSDVRSTPEAYLGKRLASFITRKQPANSSNGPVGSVGVEAYQHATILRSSTQISSLEVLEMSAASAGTEVRFPFFDKRVIEFCLGLPSEAKLDGGWIRLVLRQAMEGLLPASVQWRRSKFDFTPHLAMGLVSHHAQLIETVLDGADFNLGDYVNLDAVKADFKEVQRTGFLAKGVKMQSVWRTVILSMWLQQQRARNKSL